MDLKLYAAKIGAENKWSQMSGKPLMKRKKKDHKKSNKKLFHH